MVKIFLVMTHILLNGRLETGKLKTPEYEVDYSDFKDGSKIRTWGGTPYIGFKFTIKF